MPPTVLQGSNKRAINRVKGVRISFKEPLIIIIIIIIVPFSFPEQLLKSNTDQCTVFLRIQNKQTRIQ